MACGPASNGEAKMDDIGVFDDVLFSFQAELAGLFTLGFVAMNHEVIIRDHFGANESALDIAMDPSRSLARHRSLRDRPSSDFIFAGGKETNQIRKRVRGANKSFPRRLFDTDLLQKCRSIAFLKLSDLHFDFTGERQSLKATAG